MGYTNHHHSYHNPVHNPVHTYTNYRQRFLRNEIEMLPDRLWVVDDYAKAIAIIDMPEISVSIMPNDYLESQVVLVNSYRVKSSAHKKLFCLKSNTYIIKPITFHLSTASTLCFIEHYLS